MRVLVAVIADNSSSIVAAKLVSIVSISIVDFFPHLPGEGCLILCQMPCSSSSFSSSSFSSFSSFSFLAGPPLPALDRSGPRRTSTDSSWSQWASPDLICQLWIAVGLAGSFLKRLVASESWFAGALQCSGWFHVWPLVGKNSSYSIWHCLSDNFGLSWSGLPLLLQINPLYQ